MAWIWGFSEGSLDFGADIDYAASAPISGGEYFRDKPVNPDFRPVYRSRSGLKRFKRYHYPPIGVGPVVDAVWRDVILQFVPEDRVQFLPVTLVARGEVCEDFMWVIPFDRACCIDAEKSEVTSSAQATDGRTLIYSVKRIVLRPDCMNGLHLARDMRMGAILLVSDDLKQALAATGEESVFERPGESE
ncbi:imm11 family protein [Oricola sp.]|uniref:imm11 family protein n=1 Tax=Oricola sp. TaxID=1979950 RepID=UPI003BA9EFB3